MGLKELHPCWPEFKLETKHYICMYQIDGNGSHPFYGNESITYAHTFNGNLARYWQAEHGKTAANETGEFPNKTGIWYLSQGERRIKLTVEYIDPQNPPIIDDGKIDIDDNRVEHESKSGKFKFSEQTKKHLNMLLQKL